MARPKRTTEQEWYDIFADADLADQAAMMQTIEAIHRQARRGRLREFKQPPADESNDPASDSQTKAAVQRALDMLQGAAKVESNE